MIHEGRVITPILMKKVWFEHKRRGFNGEGGGVGGELNNHASPLFLQPYSFSGDVFHRP